MRAVRDVSLNVPAGQFLTLQANAGSIAISGRDVLGWPDDRPSHRGGDT